MTEPRRWTIYDESETFNPRWTIGDGTPPPANEYAERVEVMPVSEHEEAMVALRAQLAGAEQACAEFKMTCEGLLGDRERAVQSDHWRIRCDDLEAELAKAREITAFWTSDILDAVIERSAAEMAVGIPGSEHRWIWGTIAGMARTLLALEAALGHGSEQ